MELLSDKPAPPNIECATAIQPHPVALRLASKRVAYNKAANALKAPKALAARPRCPDKSASPPSLSFPGKGCAWRATCRSRTGGEGSRPCPDLNRGKRLAVAAAAFSQALGVGAFPGLEELCPINQRIIAARSGLWRHGSWRSGPVSRGGGCRAAAVLARRNAILAADSVAAEPKDSKKPG